MQRRFTATHRPFFLLGAVYYLFLPQTLGYSGAFSNDSLSLLDKYFEPSNPWWPHLVAYTLMAPAMYLLGSAWAPLRRQSLDRQPSQRSAGVWILLPIYALLLAAFTFQSRSVLGAGYESIDISMQGQLATLEMLLLYQYLYERGKNYSTTNAFGLLLALNSLVLLSMGGRLYVLSSLIAIYFRWWNWGSASKKSQIRSLAFAICTPACLVALGMWRVGETNNSLVGFYIVAESIFTSISSFSLFAGGRWSLLDIPNEFLGAFLNIVPSALWPDKANWLAALAATQEYETPLGAVSIIASTVANFGWVGGLLFFLGVGVCMTAVGRTRGQPAREARYSYLVGLLPFMFFRDPFQVQVKVVMTGFVLYWLTVLWRHRRVATPVEARPDAGAPQPRLTS